jgi:hypothetical protein
VYKAYLQVRRINRSPTNKLRLKFKEKKDPSLTEKVIVLDDTPPQPANKKSTRKSTQKINLVSTKAQIRVSSTKHRKVQDQRRVTRAMIS